MSTPMKALIQERLRAKIDRQGVDPRSRADAMMQSITDAGYGVYLPTALANTTPLIDPSAYLIPPSPTMSTAQGKEYRAAHVANTTASANARNNTTVNADANANVYVNASDIANANDTANSNANERQHHADHEPAALPLGTEHGCVKRRRGNREASATTGYEDPQHRYAQVSEHELERERERERDLGHDGDRHHERRLQHRNVHSRVTRAAPPASSWIYNTGDNTANDTAHRANDPVPVHIAKWRQPRPYPAAHEYPDPHPQPRGRSSHGHCVTTSSTPSYLQHPHHNHHEPSPTASKSSHTAPPSGADEGATWAAIPARSTGYPRYETDAFVERPRCPHALSVARSSMGAVEAQPHSRVRVYGEILSPKSKREAKEFVEKRQRRATQGTPRTMATQRWLQSLAGIATSENSGAHAPVQDTEHAPTSATRRRRPRHALAVALATHSAPI